jgi:hypothetical protein
MRRKKALGPKAESFSELDVCPIRDLPMPTYSAACQAVATVTGQVFAAPAIDVRGDDYGVA